MPDKKQNPQVIANDDKSLVYLPMIGAMLNLADDPAVKSTSPIEVVNGSSEIIEWGNGNDYANNVEERAHNNTLIPAVLQFKANHMAAAGLEYGYVDGYDSNGKPIIQPFESPEIEEFWERNNKRLFLQDLYRNLFWWSHGYVDFVMNKAKTKIVAMSVQDSMHCRFSKQNVRTGNKDFVYIDANFPNNTAATTQKVRCIDPYFDWMGQMESLPGVRFIYPVFFNSPGRTFYQRTPWHSVIDSKWLDLAEKIPVFKIKLLENQMVIKYVIHVPNDYWKTEYKNWETMTDAERKAAKYEKVTAMNKDLTGIEKTGKAIVLTYATDYGAKQYAKWEVQEMKGTLGDGAYIEDSQEASDHILFSMAFDGTLIGKTPGKSLGAGSGSDKNNADAIFFKNHKPYSDVAVETMTVKTRYNKIKAPNNKRVVWYQPNQVLTTLNNVTPKNRPGGEDK